MEKKDDAKRKEQLRKNSKKKVNEVIFSKRGADFIAKNGGGKRISVKKISDILFKFTVDTILLVLEHDKNGGYLEYYLMHSDEYTYEEVTDYIKCFNTIGHLQNMLNIPKIKEKKFVDVEQLLRYSSACMIFEYKYHQDFLKEWQDRLFKILTLQELPKK